MHDDANNIERYERLLEQLNVALDSASWDETPLIDRIGTQLRQYRDELTDSINELKQAQETESGSASSSTQQGESLPVEVYVSLYNSEGAHLENWITMLQNIKQNVITRPIYTQESDAKAWVRSRLNPKNESYVAILLNPSSIAPETTKPIVDKLGNRLLSLKGTSQMDIQILRFVHQDNEYNWMGNSLRLSRPAPSFSRS